MSLEQGLDTGRIVLDGLDVLKQKDEVRRILRIREAAPPSIPSTCSSTGTPGTI
ncbi:MAG: hypothetical protein HY510_08625 [Acidobacteria bacterium]|nr:hypothetical protein [Acidobacteriota bacterium]